MTPNRNGRCAPMISSTSPACGYHQDIPVGATCTSSIIVTADWRSVLADRPALVSQVRPMAGYSSETREQAYQRWQARVSLPQISAELGVCARTLESWRSADGWIARQARE